SDIVADVIIAEPVGSCADLSATIVNPLKKYHGTELTISPLTVLADPSRLSSILQNGDGGVHEDAAYIYRKQLEEADVILITKTDMLTKEQTDKTVADTQQTFPTAKVMAISSAAGVGVDEWLQEVSSRTEAGKTLLDIDYDRYAHGEAVLGWLNGTLHLEGEGICWDDVLKDIMSRLTSAITSESLRVGHVKLIMECGKDYAVTNLTGADNQTTLRGKAGVADEAKLIINARVETSPEHLDQLVRNVLIDSLPDNCQEEVLAWRYLQPGRPNPTHRFNETVI
ncbi:MAG: cobalamin synthesis protein P47K, partial [Bacteroidaceae bacterium]|nr:cobalamin synthesis protein P47K [Bacteroidaceae bacterium]